MQGCPFCARSGEKGDFAANIAKQGARAQAAVDDRLTQFAA